MLGKVKKIDNSVQNTDSISFRDNITANNFKNQIQNKAPKGMVWIILIVKSRPIWHIFKPIMRT